MCTATRAILRALTLWPTKKSVISGHTKSCYPKISRSLCGGIKADFIRNMLVDAVWPVEQLGKEYVFAPIMYIGRDAL
jgi:hypothetical protein